MWYIVNAETEQILDAMDGEPPDVQWCADHAGLSAVPEKKTAYVAQKIQCNICGEIFLDNGDGVCPFCGSAELNYEYSEAGDAD